MLQLSLTIIYDRLFLTRKPHKRALESEGEQRSAYEWDAEEGINGGKAAYAVGDACAMMQMRYHARAHRYANFMMACD